MGSFRNRRQLALAEFSTLIEPNSRGGVHRYTIGVVRGEIGERLNAIVRITSTSVLLTAKRSEIRVKRTDERVQASRSTPMRSKSSRICEVQDSLSTALGTVYDVAEHCVTYRRRGRHVQVRKGNGIRLSLDASPVGENQGPVNVSIVSSPVPRTLNQHLEVP